MIDHEEDSQPEDIESGAEDSELESSQEPLAAEVEDTDEADADAAPSDWEAGGEDSGEEEPRELEGATLVTDDDDPEFEAAIAEEMAADAEAETEGADFDNHEDDDEDAPRESADLLLARMRLESKVEAVLFASPKPMKLTDITTVLDDPNISPDDVQMVIDDLMEQYQNRQGGFFLNYIKRQGYQFRTTPSAGRLMERMFASRPRPLSRAAQETLAIIAYRQPVTRAEVEFIRGVDAGSIIKTLIERDMIRCVGRKEVAGRPMLFGTTDEFCKIFQIGSLKELPPLDAFQPENEQIRTALEKIEAHEAETEVDLEDYVGDPSSQPKEGPAQRSEPSMPDSID